MALAEVLSKVSFVNPADGDEEFIKTVISDFYNNPDSVLGRQLLDKIAVSNVNLIFNNNFGDGNSATIGGFEVFYDFDEISRVSIITSTGRVMPMIAQRAILHEVIHAVAGLSDLDPDPTNWTTAGMDYVGDTVTVENALMSEMGDNFDRNSYKAILVNDTLSTLEAINQYELTDGKHIGLALVDIRGSGPGFDAIDTSDRTDDVLLVGLSGDDQITSGAGNDYLYGGIGNDTLNGGGGNDHLFGGSGNDILISNLGSDVMFGGSDNDTFNVGSGAQHGVLVGGSGQDIFNIDMSTMGPGVALILDGGTGADTFNFTNWAGATLCFVDRGSLTDGKLSAIDLASQSPESFAALFGVPLEVAEQNTSTYVIMIAPEINDSITINGNLIKGGQYHLLEHWQQDQSYPDPDGNPHQQYYDVYSMDYIGETYNIGYGFPRGDTPDIPYNSFGAWNSNFFAAFMGFRNGDLGITFSGNGPWYVSGDIYGDSTALADIVAGDHLYNPDEPRAPLNIEAAFLTSPTQQRVVVPTEDSMFSLAGANTLGNHHDGSAGILDVNRGDGGNASSVHGYPGDIIQLAAARNDFQWHGTTGADTVDSMFEYETLDGASRLSPADIVANSDYELAGAWYEPEPIGGLL